MDGQETKDGKNSAQWEHTIYIGKEGAEILTLKGREKFYLDACKAIEEKNTHVNQLSKQFDDGFLRIEEDRSEELSIFSIKDLK